MSTQTIDDEKREDDLQADDVSRETLNPEPPEDPADTPPEATESEGETDDTERPATDETDETDSENDGIRKVRREAANYRTQLREAETELQDVKAQLFAAKVSASGKFADPSDMPVDLDMVNDDAALYRAIDELLEHKPHLRARQFGNIGQGERGTAQGVSLGSILRNNA